MESIILDDFDQITSLQETEEGDRIKLTIEQYDQRVRNRIAHIKTIKPPLDKKVADNITVMINRSTKNVIDIYNNIDNDDVHLNVRDNVEKLEIKRKCMIYFSVVNEIAKVFNGKRDSNGELYLKVLTYK